MSMISSIQKKTASSREGAKGLIKGIIACAFQNMAFMLPTTLLYFLVSDMLDGESAATEYFSTLSAA